MTHQYYDQLVTLAEANLHLLTGYKEDLHQIDRQTLEDVTPDTEFLWVLRENGTALMPLRQARHPVEITYWLTEPAQVYHLHDGEVERVSYQSAEELARLPARAGDKLWRPSGFHYQYVRDGNILGHVEHNGLGWYGYSGLKWSGPIEKITEAMNWVEEQFR